MKQGGIMHICGAALLELAGFDDALAAPLDRKLGLWLLLIKSGPASCAGGAVSST